MTKKEIAKIKSYIAKSNRDFGYTNPDTGVVSPNTKIRIARKDSKIYQDYVRYNSVPKSPLLYWGPKDSDYGQVIPMDKFAKVQKWATKQVNKPGAILLNSKSDTQHLMMRNVMRNPSSIKGSLFYNELRVASENSYKAVTAGLLAKMENKKLFVQMKSKDSYTMLDSIVDLNGELTRTTWSNMNQKEKLAWMAENAIGTRKTGTLYFYGDSI